MIFPPSQTIHFKRRDTANSLPGIILVGDRSDWENMRQQVLELIKILREWEPPMSAAAAPSSDNNRKDSKSISSIKSRYWTERALRLLDAPMMESALGKLLDTVGGKDTGAWWGKILVAGGGGGGGEERPGWLPRLLHFHTVCKNKQVRERDIVGATVHHLTLTLDDRFRKISRVCLLEGVAGYIKGEEEEEDEDEKWLQCRHSWALFAEDSSVFHRQFKRNKRKCKR